MARLDKERFFLIKTARCVRFQSWANTKLPFPMSISVVRAVTPVQESQWRRGEMLPKSSLGTWGWNSQEAARRRPDRTRKGRDYSRSAQLARRNIIYLRAHRVPTATMV